MSHLRNSKLLARLAALLLLVGMLAQGFAPHAAMLVDDGICHADTTPDAPSTPPTQDHDACCVLCHLPSGLQAVAPPNVPLPGFAGAAPALIFAVRPAASPLTTAYAARAPPLHA